MFDKKDKQIHKTTFLIILAGFAGAVLSDIFELVINNWKSPLTWFATFISIFFIYIIIFKFTKKLF